MRMSIKPLSGFLVTVALMGGCHTTSDEACTPPSHCTETSSAPAWPAAGEIYPETSIAPPSSESLHYHDSSSPLHYDESTSGYPAHSVPYPPQAVLPESDMAPMAPGVLPEPAKTPMDPDMAPGNPETGAGLLR